MTPYKDMLAIAIYLELISNHINHGEGKQNSNTRPHIALPQLQVKVRKNKYRNYHMF